MDVPTVHLAVYKTERAGFGSRPFRNVGTTRVDYFLDFWRVTLVFLISLRKLLPVEAQQMVPTRNGRPAKRGPPDEDCQLNPLADQYDSIDPPSPED